MSLLRAGHPKYECMVDQNTIVNMQNVAMQDVLKYHLTEDSESSQKVRVPKINNKIGNAMLIYLLFSIIQP